MATGNGFELNACYSVKLLEEVILQPGQVLLVECLIGEERKWCHHYAKERGWNHDVFIVKDFQTVMMFKCHECKNVFYEKEMEHSSDGYGDNSLWFCPNTTTSDDEDDDYPNCGAYDFEDKEDNTMSYLGDHFPNCVAISIEPLTIRQRKRIKNKARKDTSAKRIEKPKERHSLTWCGDKAFDCVDSGVFIITLDLKSHLRGRWKNIN